MDPELLAHMLNERDLKDALAKWQSHAKKLEKQVAALNATIEQRDQQVKNLSEKLRNSEDDAARNLNRAKKAEKGEAEAKKAQAAAEAQVAELLAMCEQLQASNETLRKAKAA